MLARRHTRDSGNSASHKPARSQNASIFRSLLGAHASIQASPMEMLVFSKLPVVSTESHDLTVRGREQRQCLRVSFQLPSGNTAHFFAVHLGTSFTERRRQARDLLSPDVLLSSGTAKRRIIAGDFNEWSRGLATQMLSHHFESADILMHLKRRRTYPGVLPLLHLDHIYYDPDFKLRDMHLYRTKLALRASDHLPLIATFSEVQPEEASVLQ